MLTLELEGYAGSTIENCASELCRIATLIGVATTMKFNTVILTAFPNHRPETLVAQFHIQVRKPNDDVIPKMAFSSI